MAFIDCKPEQVLEIGDHWLVVGRVLDLQIGIPPLRPLVFHGGRYQVLGSASPAPAPDLADVHDEPAHIFYDRWADGR
jgi:3-hydroxy-9,10-secoandrosta-1,3,5(10)-triene-9,17-dione monooxygenase reductase component